MRLNHKSLSIALPVIALFVLPACDVTSGDSLREKLGVELDEAALPLAKAIESAQAEAPDGIVLEAKLDVHTNATTYDVTLLDLEAEREVDVSPEDGTILRDRSRRLDADKLTEAKVAAELVSGSIGWTALIEAAEAKTGGIAFDVEADGDDGVLEVELLVDDVVWEVEAKPDGTIVKSEVSDDQLDEPAEDKGDDEDEAEDENEDEAEDEDEDEAEDEAEDEDEDEAEDDNSGPG